MEVKSYGDNCQRVPRRRYPGHDEDLERSGGGWDRVSAGGSLDGGNGRGHICNTSYAVASASRGNGIGGKLVRDSLDKARSLGFRIMQFNAVVASNTYARRLYEGLGFVQLGVIPKGFRMKDGTYQDICPYYIEL